MPASRPSAPAISQAASTGNTPSGTPGPDFAFVLCLTGGKRLSKLPLESGPDSITLEGDRARIETYAHSYVFELK